MPVNLSNKNAPDDVVPTIFSHLKWWARRKGGAFVHPTQLAPYHR
jgi:hypothetical protein